MGKSDRYLFDVKSHAIAPHDDRVGVYFIHTAHEVLLLRFYRRGAGHQVG